MSTGARAAPLCVCLFVVAEVFTMRLIALIFLLFAALHTTKGSLGDLNKNIHSLTDDITTKLRDIKDNAANIFSSLILPKVNKKVEFGKQVGKQIGKVVADKARLKQQALSGLLEKKKSFAQNLIEQKEKVVHALVHEKQELLNDLMETKKQALRKLIFDTPTVHKKIIYVKPPIHHPRIIHGPPLASHFEHKDVHFEHAGPHFDSYYHKEPIIVKPVHEIHRPYKKVIVHTKIYE